MSDEVMIHVYPNPFVDQLRLCWFSQTQAILHLELFDMNGKLIRQFDVEGSEGEYQQDSLVHCDDLNEGVYVLRCRIGEREKNFMLVRTGH